MTVSLTRHLEAQITALRVEPADFCEWFALWKARYDADEENSAMFGKDGGYVLPRVAGEKYRLRHVHLVPLLDQREKDRWYRLYAAGRRRTSDRVLIYVKDDAGNYLLIAILDEPTAHEIAQMTTSEDKAIMEGFAVAAEEFLIDGAIVV